MSGTIQASAPRSFLSPWRWWFLSSAAMAVVVIGFLDNITGWELSLFVLYGLPIFIFVWYGSWTAGMILAVICTVIWWLANKAENPYATWWGYQMAAASRLVYFMIVVAGSAVLKTKQNVVRSQIEALERTRALEREIVRVSEREQRRIGQDLHDGLCQHLAAIGCAAKSLADDLEGAALPEAGVAHEIETLIKGAVIEARDLSRGMFPVQMDAAGLVAALDGLAATTRRLTSVNVTFTEIGDACIPDPETSMHLYRIAQESLANAIKHAAPRQVSITLKAERDRLRLTVEDDGAGFFRETGSEDGMGLRTMAYRARLIGASLEIQECDGPGTCVCCEIPYSAITSKEVMA